MAFRIVTQIDIKISLIGDLLMIAKGNVKIGIEWRFGTDWPGQRRGVKHLHPCKIKVQVTAVARPRNQQDYTDTAIHLDGGFLLLR